MVVAQSVSHSHITDDFAPLEQLAIRALGRYGDFHPGTVIGDVSMMFLDFANEVIEDLRQHPYWGMLAQRDGITLNYYTALADKRPIPDPIVVAGLLYHYSLQQQSTKAEVYGPMYTRTMNSILWDRLNGNTAIQLRVVDDGAHSDSSQGFTTSEINGLPEETVE